ncbi:oligosaccharide flippase family protein [Litoreibacter sp.]|nr:oligosaccharide flippase family protein [Litoreibacter sp.]
MAMSSTFGALRPTAHPLMVLLSGHGGVAALTLTRNIVAARLIGAEQFGIAAGFAIIISAVEMATTLGVQQMIVQDREGDEVGFLSSLHLVQLMRGMFGAFVIFAFAEAISRFLGNPDTAWAIRTLALIPLLTGLVHLDAWRYQRAARFGPSVIIQIGPALLALLLIWPLHKNFMDFRILLIAALVQAAGVLLMSHLVAERRYVAAFQAAHLRRVLQFGYPLALNGLLLLAVFHGEKLLVGHLRGATDLAVLAMGFTLTLTPALILGKSLQSYALPTLSAARDDSDSFRANANNLLRLCLWLGVALSLALSLLSPVVPRLLGQGFEPLGALFPILAALHGIRVIKTGVSVSALALGASANTAWGNVPRVLALPIIYLALQQGSTVEDILWIAITAEAAGLFAAFALLKYRMDRL